MGLFDDHVGKNRRHLTFFKIQFFEHVGPEILCPVGYGEYVVLRDSRVTTLEVRYPETGFRNRSSGNLPEKLELVRVNLLKYGGCAMCAGRFNFPTSKAAVSPV
jgi:hypothetical protein